MVVDFLPFNCRRHLDTTPSHNSAERCCVSDITNFYFFIKNTNAYYCICFQVKCNIFSLKPTILFFLFNISFIEITKQIFSEKKV